MTNDKEKVLTSGVVNTQLSDHSVVYTILRSSAPGTRSRKICFRSLKNFSRENFVHDMQIVPFHITDLFDELDDKVYAIWAIVSRCSQWTRTYQANNDTW